jgi:hypothetical protein
MTTNNLRIKQLIAAYLHFKEVYETDLSEEQLTNVRNTMYDFLSFVDEFVDEFGGGDDDEDYIGEDEDNGLYILNDETGEMEKYDWNYIDNINSSNDDEEQNSNPATTNNNEYMGDEFDYQYDKARQYKHN